MSKRKHPIEMILGGFKLTNENHIKTLRDIQKCYGFNSPSSTGKLTDREESECSDFCAWINGEGAEKKEDIQKFWRKLVPRKMVNFNRRIPEDIYEKLEALSKASQRSLTAEMTHLIVSAELEGKEKKKNDEELIQFISKENEKLRDEIKALDNRFEEQSIISLFQECYRVTGRMLRDELVVPQYFKREYAVQLQEALVQFIHDCDKENAFDEQL